VSDHTTFYLQNVSGGLPLTPEGTLDVVRVRVFSADRPPHPAQVALDSVLERLLAARSFRRLEAFLQRYGAVPRVGRVRFGSLRRVTPVSRQWGFDRGGPIDRYFIGAFLAAHAEDIRGVVLEIGDDTYTRLFGSDRVGKTDVLSLEEKPNATIIADLTNADHLPSDTYDCIILTQVLQYIYDLRAGLRTLHRILRPGGVVLATLPGIMHTSDGLYGSICCWSFTPLSARRLFSEFFPGDAVEVRGYGNVLAAAAFLYGLGEQELSREELDYRESGYDLTIAVRAVKSGGSGQVP
jgi:hypothetical protein